MVPILPYQLGMWKIHKSNPMFWFHGVHYPLKLSPIPKGLFKKKTLTRVSTKHPLEKYGQEEQRGEGAKPTSKNTLHFTPNTFLDQIALQIVPFSFFIEKTPSPSCL
jgi:hypothetical protein